MGGLALSIIHLSKHPEELDDVLEEVSTHFNVISKSRLLSLLFYNFGFYNNKIHHQTALVAVIGDIGFARFPSQHQS